MDPAEIARYAALALASAGAGAVNSVAGGGTLLTFPTLLWLGLPAVEANATSTVGLLAGTFASVGAYRRELGERRALIPHLLPSSLAGGVAGAALLLATPPPVFALLVPGLILGATLLFVAQEPVRAWLDRRSAAAAAGLAPAPSRLAAALVLFVVAIYGGYFGAGLGILTLATLGLLRIESIHEMNGLKTLSGGAVNAVAAAIFIAKGLIDWRAAGVMLAASILGGWFGADGARRLGQRAVRRIVIAVGLLAAAATAAANLRASS